MDSSQNALKAKPDKIAEYCQNAAERLNAIRQAIDGIILGQTLPVELALVTLLCGGHGLVVGVPGLAKTKLVSTLGKIMGMETRRIQFTPDLMPGDILGSEVLEQHDDGRKSFRFIKGPIFSQLLMADEIARASPRTQSALLQAMQEHHITINGLRYDLPKPFHVLATQNPIEQEGIYPLPEAQLDRFLLRIDIDFPSRDAEKNIILTTTSTKEPEITTLMHAEELIEMQKLVRLMPISDRIVEAILTLVRQARPGSTDGGEKIIWGPGPRAAQALMLGARALALLDRRLAPEMADIAKLAVPVMLHRMELSYASRREGLNGRNFINLLTNKYLQ